MAKKEKIEFAGDLAEDKVINKAVQLGGEFEPQSYSERQDVIKNTPIISCLRDERIIVRFIGKTRGIVNNPENPYYGGMGETCKRKYVVPQTTSGKLVNVLTNSEKSFLEDFMGLEPNSLSIYRKNDNFWEEKSVSLKKGDNHFDLSNPDDYIAYKILILNQDEIAPSLEDYKNAPKVTHMFYILREGEEAKRATDNLSTSASAYVLFGEIRKDFKKLRLVVETMEGKSLVKNVDKETLYSALDKHLKSNPKLFISIASDPYLDTKVLIREAVDYGVINKRGDYYYLKANNLPLCKPNGVQEPTLKSACEFLNEPRNLEIKLSLEANIKSLEENK